MKFTRSVAMNSIIGHILGIGDRHTKNILVHQKTGEVVHIDFGIVFEQGKVRILVVDFSPG
jgi:ataxia telangiectasia mutated family protein